MKDYIVQHWRGKLSLARSYWVNGVGLSWVLMILMLPWVKSMEQRQTFSTTEAVAALVIALLVGPVFVAWLLVGIWRSTNNYEGRRLWKCLAKIAVVVGLLGGLKEYLEAFGY